MAVAAKEKNAFANLLGKRGKVTARCSPIGTALIEGGYWEVQSSDALLEPETLIEVEAVRGKSIFIKAIDSTDL